jgi:hypothetical protein
MPGIVQLSGQQTSSKSSPSQPCGGLGKARFWELIAFMADK